MDSSPSQPASKGAQTAPENKVGDTQPFTPSLPAWRRFLLNLIGGTPYIDSHLRELVSTREEDKDPLSDEEKQIIQAAMRFSKVTADSLSIPRSDIICISENSSIDDIIATFTESGFSRLPVIRQDVDDIIGFINIKDVVPILHSQQSFRLKDILHPCSFVPETLSISKALDELREHKVEIAIVVDEYGGTSGLLTLKDIIEHLVGDLDDEHSNGNDNALITSLQNGKYSIDPRMELEDLEEKLGEPLKAIDSTLDNDLHPDNRDFETVGGLLLFLSKKVPLIGDSFKLRDGYVFKVTDADARRIKTLELTLPDHKKGLMLHLD